MVTMVTKRRALPPMPGNWSSLLKVVPGDAVTAGTVLVGDREHESWRPRFSRLTGWDCRNVCTSKDGDSFDRDGDPGHGFFSQGN